MRTQDAEVVTLQRIAEAALLLAVFTAMAFQYIRFEVFETEKNAILGLLAMIIVGANVAEFVRLGRFPNAKSPLLYAVAAFLGVVTVSTLFSLSFWYSLWGSPTRGHGWTMIAIYAVLFWQAARSGQRLQEALIPILAMTWLPIIIWAWQLYLEAGIGERYRPPSTAGNPNYLAGWLTMFMAVFGFVTIQRMSRWRFPLKRYQMMQGVLYIGILAVSFVTFVILSSRGAFAGFAVAFVTGTVMMLSLYRKRAILIAVVVATVMGAFVYVNISLNFQEGRDANFSGVERLFILYDDSRSFLWEAATNIVSQQAEPFTDADGDTDTWAFLRPAIGYGPETLELTQNRFGEEFEASQWGSRFVERFHNLFWDWIAETGSLGALTLLFIYQSAFYLGMRHLGFINQGQVWYWLGIQVVMVPVGVVITTIVFTRTEWVALIPLGGALGSLVGLWIWMIRAAFVAPPESEEEDGETEDVDEDAPKIFTPQRAVVMATVCAIAAQWVDNQFGFMQILSQTLFFVMLGLLVGASSEPGEIEEITYSEAEAIPEARYWQVGTIIAGLFVLYGFGQAIDSTFTQAGIGAELVSIGPVMMAEYVLFLIIVFIVGMFGMAGSHLQAVADYEATFEQSKSKRKKKKQQYEAPELTPVMFVVIAAVIVGAWVIFYLFRVALVEQGSTMLDTALTQQTGPDPAGVRGAYSLLSLNGIVLILVSVGLLYWYIRGKTRFAFGFGGLALVPIFFILGALFYSQNFAVSTMRATANGFTGIDQVEPLIAADTIYEVAASGPYGSGDVKLQLGWVDSLITQTSYVDVTRQQQLLSRIQEQTQEALDVSPFFVNSKTWEAFNPRYEIIQQRLQAIAVPQNPTAAGQQPNTQQPQTQEFALPPGAQQPPPPPDFAIPQGGQQLPPPGVNFPTAPPPGAGQ